MKKLRREKIIEIVGWSIGVIIFVFIIKNYFRPFIWMVILFLAGNPINSFVRKKIKYRGVSAGITILFINIIGVLAIIYLGNTLIDGVGDIIQGNLKQLKKFFMEFEVGIEGIVGQVNLMEQVKEFLKLDYLTIGATTTGDEVISYFIGNICTFFLLLDKKNIKNVVEQLISEKINRRINRIFYNLKNIIKIQASLIIISTVIIIIGFKILKIDNYLFMGILCGTLDILPYVGTIIVFIPIIIYNIIVKNYLIAFGLICLYLLVRFIVEILEAKMVSDKFNMHPLLSLLSLYLGVKVFGVLGAFIGPIFCMTIVDIIIEN